ncbi:hypothetical protein HYH02_006844 [Chlamydomonas schloesseri]|uniref:histone acetyltransferase n=1 Tax=Chlamydomonas schloesseri TaxID=2026947 RepID=A0A835WK08_9CHLO|nr:hypothetical protein HYH02_006844 [Chlamydomonas schloesseri]|eukprot:KAG2448260.1 hypothetical protein HYH02_006844 [Chlamydomonas schloesseri]
MEQQNEPLQKRARIAPAEVQPQAPSPACAVQAQGNAVSSATGTTVAPTAAVVGPVKPAAAAAAASANPGPSAGIASVPKPSPAAGATSAAGAPKPAAGTAKPPSFIADAREAVRFRALTCRDADALQAEIAAGGAPVHVDFLHQHFGDSEQIRGYSNLIITIWFHIQTFHAWVDVSFATKRPGADKLSDIWEGAFPEGYCSSKEDFVEQVVRTAASLPDLLTLGECVGTVPVRPSSAAGLYGLGTAPQQAAAADTPAAAAPHTAHLPLEVSVRRFQLLTAPPEVKALHARLEPLLLFTIDGANFIDGDDPQWELLLPVVRAPDGGCLVLGLTTLFNFWAYPASCRLRVSQVLVLSPWQGLGLGKALLKLSYDLAKSRGCADLTVEDPTPNLQRVREKLEVEMLRRLDWVVAQANKCLDAAARGETTWPACLEPESEPQQAEPAKAQDAAAAPEQSAASEGQQQQPGAQQQGGEQRHSLLSTHAFFGALGVAPPERTSVPSSVLAEATAFAEARWRKRLQEAEAAAASAMAVDGAAVSDDADATADGAVGASGATAAGSGGAAGPSSSGAAAVPACGALVPSSAFINAITKETKMHRGQVRVVWEALLWSQPGALQRARVKAALEDLISRRLESQHFSSVGRAAAAKRIVECPTVGKDGKTHPAAKPSTEDGEGSEGELLVTNFFMYRPTARESAPGAASGLDGGAADTGVVATGRLNLTQVTAEDKTSRMEELMAERRQQLSSLAAILNKGATAVKPKPTQIRSLPSMPPAEGGVTTVGFGAPLATTAAADGAAGPVLPAGERKRKGPADMAAMMKALEGRM